MERRVETSAALAKMTTKKDRSFLGNIITMDKSVVSKYNPKTKAQSKQWLEKKAKASKRQGQSKLNKADGLFLL
jgi:hypothetical protein